MADTDAAHLAMILCRPLLWPPSERVGSLAACLHPGRMQRAHTLLPCPSMPMVPINTLDIDAHRYRLPLTGPGPGSLQQLRAQLNIPALITVCAHRHARLRARE